MTMMHNSSNRFGMIDYISVLFTLLISLLIGFYFATKNKTTDDLLLGSRKITSWPVSFSVMASYISAVTIIGYPGEVYGYGIEIFQMALVSLIIFPISVKFFLPILYPMKLTSLFEYVEHRFKSPSLRKLIAGVYIFEQIMLAGIILYGPSLVLVTFLGIPAWVSIFGIGLLCTLYTGVGGIQAVVWTDAFQAIMMICGMLAILIKLLISAGGFSQVFHIAYDNGRLNLFKMNWDPFRRHNFFNFWTGFAYMVLFRTSFHQQQVQRFSSQPTLEAAKSAMYRSIPITLMVKLLTVTTGIALFAFYVNCDPIRSKQVDTIDHLIPYFVVNQMESIPGILGLFTACIFSAVLSSISSSINSLTAVAWTDFLSHVPTFVKMDSRGQANVLRVIGFVFGILSIFVGFGAEYMGSVYTASYQVIGITSGVVSATFLVGLFMPFINATSAKTAVVLTIVTMLPICAHNIFSPSLKEPTLLTHVDGCLIHTLTITSTQTNSTLVDHVVDSEWPTKIFRLSYLMYPLVATCIFLLIATIVSFSTGGFKCDPTTFDSKYLHPCIQRRMKLKHISHNSLELESLNAGKESQV